jgi:hypothetical protein
MNFNEFISKYDFEGSVVLLEGKRDVKENEKAKLVELGIKLAENSKHLIARSGNADGADFYFSQGFSEIAKDRLEVIVPSKGHRKKHNVAGTTYNLDEFKFLKEDNVIYETNKNTKNKGLVDMYVDGVKNRISAKAPYLIRDTMKVVGHNEIDKCNYAIFYDDLANPKQGGTGHTILVCQNNNIPYINQSVWFNWLG